MIYICLFVINFVVVDGFNYFGIKEGIFIVIECLLICFCCYLFNEFSLVKIKKYQLGILYNIFNFIEIFKI